MGSGTGEAQLLEAFDGDGYSSDRVGASGDGEFGTTTAATCQFTATSSVLRGDQREDVAGKFYNASCSAACQRDPRAFR